MTTYPATAVPEPVADLLDLIAADDRHATDRTLIESAIRECAAADPDGVIDPNQLRVRLAGRVYPNVIGATVSALARSGVIVATGWVISDDLKSRNSGKPQRTWRLSP